MAWPHGRCRATPSPNQQIIRRQTPVLSQFCLAKIRAAATTLVEILGPTRWGLRRDVEIEHLHAHLPAHGGGPFNDHLHSPAESPDRSRPSRSPHRSPHPEAARNGLDPLPRAVAWHIGCLHALVMTEIGRRTAAGEHPDAIAEAVLELLDIVESLLGERVLGYAVREE
jgi:hypothetical protein